MNISLSKLAPLGFNQRILTEQDFYSICETENIKVLEIDVPTNFYFCALGQHTIVIKKRLRGLKRPFAMFHELAHYFLHGGKSAAAAFFFGLNDSKAEIEAEMLAVIALVPLCALRSFDYLEDHPNRFARKIYRDRQRIWFLYGV